MTITPRGGRVLGCLVEKELTTPQQYPLTLNALALACSQTTNRDPVMTLDESEVEAALGELKELHLVRFVLPSHGRSVTRYRHVLDEAHGLDRTRTALLAVLLLRGPQTAGELRSRTARMAEFDTLESLLGELRVLADQPEPLVRLLARQPGQKEDRWQQLVAAESGAGNQDRPGPSDGTPPGPEPAPVDTPHPGSGPDREDPAGLGRRVADLASEVAMLRQQLADVGASLDALRKSLGE